jgi:hypothetical protein
MIPLSRSFGAVHTALFQGQVCPKGGVYGLGMPCKAAIASTAQPAALALAVAPWALDVALFATVPAFAKLVLIWPRLAGGLEFLLYIQRRGLHVKR